MMQSRKHLLFNILLGVSANTKSQEKEKEMKRDGKEESKLSLFTNDINSYVETIKNLQINN